mmetsp:Transcript_104444/g.248482  ORF Transcript_104444/g.248482 Transcript_104444/m.248482 type:complete len:205 (+) Transcript_104444:503-1117(+)
MTKRSALPALGKPSRLPPVYPATTARPWSKSSAQAASYSALPRCTVQRQAPEGLSCRRKMSELPALLQPSSSPLVSPATQALPKLSRRNAMASSSAGPPRCTVHCQDPEASNLARKRSLPPALVFPSKAPEVLPATRMLPSPSTRTACAKSSSSLPRCTTKSRSPPGRNLARKTSAPPKWSPAMAAPVYPATRTSSWSTSRARA